MGALAEPKKRAHLRPNGETPQLELGKLKMRNDLERRAFLRGMIALGALSIASPALAHRHADVLSKVTRARLLSGDLAIYFRHAATTWSGVDRIEWPREQQRLLSDEGISQSRQIGESIKGLDAPIGDVIASPFARCRDMAEIAFGRVEERFELLGLLSDAEGRPERVAFLREQLATPTAGAGNRMIVSHRSNIAEVAGVSLGEGDAVLALPLGEGRFETLETLKPADWVGLAAKVGDG
ncbi:MAG: histidine phosphatase family protein [Pseudomonadota bacterium]